MATPDLVLIHLGQNDLCQGRDVASTVNELAAIIDVLRTVHAKVRVVVTQIIASGNPSHAQIPAFNARLPVLVAAKRMPDSPVALADQYTNFVPATMTWDGVHSNAAGESQMADRWYIQLMPLLDKFFAASP